MYPLVSILIPAYNAERWISKTIQSALDQDYPHKEIIVVNDGSTDRTGEVAESFRSTSVLVVDQPNLGGPSARNRAMALAQGDYIQWLDHDDILGRGKVSAQMKAADAASDRRVLFSCAFAKFYYRLETATVYESPLYRDLSPVEYFLLKFSAATYFQSSCWLTSRELAADAGPWWEVRSPDDDGEYFCRVVSVSSRLMFVPKAMCYWRVGNPNSFSGAWRHSNAALDALFASTCRCIDHLGRLEDSDRSRAACVRFLQDRLDRFYPERMDIVDEARARARELGGELTVPRLKPKYRAIERLFGRSAAKRASLWLPMVKDQLRSNADRLLGSYQERRPGRWRR